MVSLPRRVRRPSSRATQPPHHPANECGLLVIGDDATSTSAATYHNDCDDLVYIILRGLKTGPRNTLPHRTKIIKHPTDIHDLDFDTIPHTALVATSKDSKNLLIATHLHLTSTIDNIVVRVNDPQSIDAFADLPVTTIDIATIAGTALATALKPSETT